MERPLNAMAFTLRPLTEADHAALIDVFDGWWDERPRPKLERLWFRHWGSTSALAVDARGRPAGLVIGFVSPDHPDEAVVRLLAVPAWARRRGVGTALVEHFAGLAIARGAVRIVAGAKPGDPPAIAFLRAMGFMALVPPGSRPSYGVPALLDAAGRGEDLALFERAARPAQAAEDATSS